VQLASRAAVPERAVGPRKLVNAAVAGLLGLLASFLIITLTAWWREDSRLLSYVSGAQTDVVS
jgi:uncharacterized protein involved in exopolysaccharide biosynthesis